MLLVQNNGQWSSYVSQLGDPHQILYGDPTKSLRVVWNITPTANTIGKQLKFCGGYFTTYSNTTLYGGWSSAYNRLSFNQTNLASNSLINLQSTNCAYLRVLPA